MQHPEDPNRTKTPARIDRGHGVYVIELDDGSLYVGSTALSFEERLHRQQEGGDVSAQVGSRKFVRLRPDLFSHLGRFVERHQAERAERKLANQLRHRFQGEGIAVLGGGPGPRRKARQVRRTDEREAMKEKLDARLTCGRCHQIYDRMVKGGHSPFAPLPALWPPEVMEALERVHGQLEEYLAARYSEVPDFERFDLAGLTAWLKGTFAPEDLMVAMAGFERVIRGRVPDVGLFVRAGLMGTVAALCDQEGVAAASSGSGSGQSQGHGGPRPLVTYQSRMAAPRGWTLLMLVSTGRNDKASVTCSPKYRGHEHGTVFPRKGPALTWIKHSDAAKNFERDVDAILGPMEPLS